MENMVLRVVITKSSITSKPISHIDEGEDGVEDGHHQILNLITSKPISHVDKGEDGVEGGHHHVRDGQVQEEVVRHTPHSSVS